MTPDPRRWRTGTHLFRTVYAERPGGDELLGFMETPELATYICEMHNQQLPDQPPADIQPAVQPTTENS